MCLPLVLGTPFQFKTLGVIIKNKGDATFCTGTAYLIIEANKLNTIRWPMEARTFLLG
jgi:hypothetical protein